MHRCWISAPQPCPSSLTLHVEGHAVGEALQLVVDHAHELLPVGFAARHQAVAADHRDGAVAVADLLELRFPFELGVPGDGAGGLPVRGGARGHQDLLRPASLGDEGPRGALHPIRGLGCKKCEEGGGGEKGAKGWLEKPTLPSLLQPKRHLEPLRP